MEDDVYDKKHRYIRKRYIHTRRHRSFYLEAGPRLGTAKEKCRNLTIHKIDSGHWMQNERADEVNEILSQWIATNVPLITSRRQLFNY